jgi:hypothetical protein
MLPLNDATLWERVVGGGCVVRWGVAVDRCGFLREGGSIKTGGTVSIGGVVDRGDAVDKGGAVMTGGAIETGGAVNIGGIIDPSRRAVPTSLMLGGVDCRGGAIKRGGPIETGGVVKKGRILGRAATRGWLRLNDDRLRTCLINATHIGGAGGQEALENERRRCRGDDHEQRNDNQRQDNY